MKKIILIILLSISFLSLANFSLAQETDSSTGLTAPKLQISIPSFKLQISIPSFSGFSSDKGAWIGEYIQAIYDYGIGIVGILASIILMWGGLLWLTAGGNQGQVTEAKSWITASLTGLVIALSSYTILYIINPDLVAFKSLSKYIVDVEKIDSPQSETMTTTIRGDLTLNKVYTNAGAPITSSDIINPTSDKRIGTYFTNRTGANGIELGMANATAELANFIENHNGEVSEGYKYPGQINLRITSANSDTHTEGSTHYEGRAIDLGSVNAYQAKFIGEWWINQGPGRRFIWEGDHLHLDIGHQPK